jgi:hypothetical protein
MSSSIIAFCPMCFAELPATAETCRRCGSSLRTWHEKPYAERLTLALRHPVADIRMRAILVLGLRREKGAAAALVDCAMRHPTDVTQGLEIVNSLRAISEAGGDRRALQALARHENIDAGGRGRYSGGETSVDVGRWGSPEPPRLLG